VQITGTRGRIEVQIPVNAPPDRPCRILIDDGSDLFGGGAETEEFPICDQYTIQGDLFARAIRENHEPIISLEESLKNMAVIDAVFASARSGQWEVPVTSLQMVKALPQKS
jgi:predicted dehydrogenase